MRYVIDHDLHIHSHLSLCSGDPGMTPDAILEYGKQNHFRVLCLTDHMWDPAVPGAEDFDFYRAQPYERTKQALPLPQAEGIRFLFGCETEQDRYRTVGISRAGVDELDFVIIPTTHLHMSGFTIDGSAGVAERAALWCCRLDAVLNMDLPFHKVGIAHLTSCLMSGRDLEVVKAVPVREYHRLFAKAARVGAGIELNFYSLKLSEEEREIALLPYQIAREEGCKFYLGSDAHTTAGLALARENFENIITLLDFTEEDKIPFLRK